MANSEHLHILSQGVDTWNQWRLDNPDLQPHLRGVDLIEANLSGADLSRVDFFEADLRRANLACANLFEADLSKACLIEADLLEADLTEAFLINADLTEANLFGAVLSRANFIGTNLTGTSCGQTIFGDIDLSTTKGLETIHHFGPSTIGIDTIYRSKGKVPEVFLRRVGVPDNFIEYFGALVGRAWEYYSCFISYSNKDRDFAERLHADLQAKGVRCWFAPEDMKIGDRIRRSIDEAIRIHDKLLIILSEHSIDSDWVETEVETALEREAQKKSTVLFPVRLDDTVMDTSQPWAGKIRRERHIGDFRHWKDHDRYQATFDRLMRDLKAE